MRFAVISDIHGNYAALDAVLADIQRRGRFGDVPVDLRPQHRERAGAFDLRRDRRERELPVGQRLQPGEVLEGKYEIERILEARADRLKAGRPDAASVIDRQLARLTADDQMGTLFKACAIFSPRSLVVPGFED